MKLPIRLLTITALCLGFMSVISPVKQPVVAYKDNNIDQSKQWTIGIYDPNKKMVSENVIFKKDTSGLGRKLYFDFQEYPEVFIYVQKLYLGGGPKGANIARLSENPMYSPNILKSKLITADDAPPGSEIRITDEEITVVDSKTPKSPKEKTRKITVYATDEVATDLPLTIQAVRTDQKSVLGENAYGKPVRIEKIGKNYQLTIPRNKDFVLIRAQDNQTAADYEKYTEYVVSKDIQPGSQLAIGEIVRIR